METLFTSCLLQIPDKYELIFIVHVSTIYLYIQKDEMSTSPLLFSEHL